MVLQGKLRVQRGKREKGRPGTSVQEPPWLNLISLKARSRVPTSAISSWDPYFIELPILFSGLSLPKLGFKPLSIVPKLRFLHSWTLDRKGTAHLPGLLGPGGLAQGRIGSEDSSGGLWSPAHFLSLLAVSCRGALRHASTTCPCKP